MIQKLRHYVPDRRRVLHVLAGWLVVVGILLLLPSSGQPRTQDTGQGVSGQPLPTAADSPTTTTAEVESESTAAPPATPQTTRQKKSSAPAAQPDTNPSGQSANTGTQPAAPANITVSLNIDDTLQGQVTVPANSNQCDVLTHALADGTINNLDMRYSPQYKTNAVYVINNVGDPGAVWWTYKVNGKSPPLGCSNTKVQRGDQIKWEYVKQ